MIGGTAKQAGQSARDLAQKIAGQMAQEPLEFLKTARDQVATPETSPQNPPPGQNNEIRNKARIDQEKAQDKMKSSRRMEALDQELKDIRKQDLFKDLQAKISQGIEVPLEDYAELSMEQKQVLKAQMEAVKYQKQQAAYNETQGGVAMAVAKPGRRMGARQRGQKAEAEKQQTRVEKPVPPSG
jgi:hypothetical protein